MSLRLDRELLEESAERSAILVIAIRRLARAIHRTHANEDVVPWTNCTEPMCLLAHDAIEGRYALNHPAPSAGRVVSIIRKEA